MPNLFLFSFFPIGGNAAKVRPPPPVCCLSVLGVLLEFQTQFLELLDWPCAFLLSAFG